MQINLSLKQKRRRYANTLQTEIEKTIKHFGLKDLKNSFFLPQIKGTW